jgi:uncharacterized protein (TIGR03435 family)
VLTLVGCKRSIRVMNPRMAFGVVSLLLLPLAVLGASPSTSLGAGQERAAAAPTAFEVASIKPNVAGEFGGSSTSYRGDSFRATNVPLSMLIQSAYGIREDRLSGGPEWLRTARFDVDARAGKEVLREQLRLMAQRLLEERFGVVLTREQREQEVYALRIARSDGRVGPDLRRAADDCDRVTIDPLTRPSPESSSGASPSMWGWCATMTTLATALARPLGTDIVDQTGLSGKWEYVLAFKAPGSNTSPFVVPGQENLPTVTVAVEEQLGLKLERNGRGLVEYFVVAAARAPTEN